jgi:hypothetical protein
VSGIGEESEVELFIHSSVSRLVVSLLGGLGLDPEDCGGEGVGDDHRRRTGTCSLARPRMNAMPSIRVGRIIQDKHHASTMLPIARKFTDSRPP